MSDTLTQRIFIGVAWPYANGEQHIGHIAGAYLPPDIFARYHRLAGHDVLMVSGSDTHGTPITVRADEEGITPGEVVDRFHPRFIAAYEKLGITFDLFTHTDTANHWATTKEFFLRHRDQGYITIETSSQLFDPRAGEHGRFLPDRYVEGTCPNCGADGARGDQCDACGATYEATDLKNPKSMITGNTALEVRPTKHFYLQLGEFQKPLLEWMESGGKDHWRTTVRNYTVSRLREDDEEKRLRGRAITRDMSWGIDIPGGEFPEKRIYVWYDAVIGYFSASREWATLTGDPEAWRTYWEPEHGAQSYYFIGKDNIPFHTIIWPGMLWGYGGLNLPYDVPANEYLNIRGQKFSKSKGRSVGINDVMERYQADAWRYTLTALAPESNDVDFTWEDFVTRVNSELLANWGNLVNRVLNITHKNFDGHIPKKGHLTLTETAILEEIAAGFDSVAERLAACRFRAAAQELLRLSSETNLYVTEAAPWKLVKEDKDRAAAVLWTALQCIDWLKIMWSPITPHMSQKLHEMLGYEGQLFGRQYTKTIKDDRGQHLVLRYDPSEAEGAWERTALPSGQALQEPEGLVEKLSLAVVLCREMGGEGATFEAYRAKDNTFRWRLTNAAGEVLFDEMEPQTKAKIFRDLVLSPVEQAHTGVTIVERGLQ
ncbi:MAG: methionine--tRNA ligase [Sumerlaeia bacterium]